MASRPYFSTPGAELAELILAGDKAAIAEGKNHRSTRQVKDALAQVKAAPTTKRLHVAGSGKANTAAHTARPTGVGSRGGDPRKAEAFAVAEASGAKVWSPDFRVAYRTHLDSLMATAS